MLSAVITSRLPRDEEDMYLGVLLWSGAVVGCEECERMKGMKCVLLGSGVVPESEECEVMKGSEVCSAGKCESGRV